MQVLFGSSGYVGGKFKEAFKFETPSSGEVDLTDHLELYRYLKLTKPQRVINCAGFTGKPNVDQCEDPDIQPLVIDGNIKIAINLANVCSKLEIPWGHVSSGCIFTGTGTQWFEEDAEPNFWFDTGSFYSTTKAIAEKLIKNKNGHIWRLRIPFDEIPDKRNYITKLLTYDKVFGAENSLSHLGDFVQACMTSFEYQPGVYNMTNPGYLFFEEVLSILKKHLPEAQHLEQIPFPKLKATRSNCVLKGSKLMRPILEAFEDAAKNYEIH